MRRPSLANFTRRDALVGAAAAAGTFALSAQGQAAAPFLNTQAPAWHRFKLGDFECTAISDGPLALGPGAGVLQGVPAEEINRLLASHFLPTDNMVLEQNALVVNTGRQLLLFDTGMGSSKAFGPGTGRLLGNLRTAGVDPSQIDGVILTHAHSDHCWG